MEKVLGRKQSIRNEDWINAMQHIEDLVKKEELDTLVDQTVSEILEQTEGKKAAFAWSGGKDSLVLERVCEMAGIHDCLMAVCDLEYPAFMEWVESHKPEKLEIINTGQNMDWLLKHQNMLFPQKSNVAAQWFHMVQHRGQARYYKTHDLDMLLLGRRRADGNYVGKGSNIYTDGKGVTRYSPLSDWSHEAILAFIHYHKVPVPPIYEWQNGYSCGTHPWPARQWTGSVENGWKEVFEIDGRIVIDAAKTIPSAREFLEKNGKYLLEHRKNCSSPGKCDKHDSKTNCSFRIILEEKPMKQLTLKLSELVRPERNIRIHTEKQLEEFERSVRMFGQIRPIVVDEKNTILAGNGLYETLLRMGEEQALVYKYEDLTESQKKKLMIADNKIFSLGIENLDTLNEFLEELNGDLDIPGFDEEILKQMVADADEVTEKISEYGTLDEEEIQQIKEANEKREQKELESASEEGKAIVQTDLPQQGGQSATMESPESAETRRFVICPKCGEQIWL